jgi:ABC-type nickel/cobalt efflux system permease component RcnA
MEMGEIGELLKSEPNAVGMLAALLTAFAMGAVHALAPGHGKTLVAAYLVGARGTFKHAAILGATVTITHTASVFVLGFATLFLTQYFMPQRLAQVLSVASGVSIVLFGLWLLEKRIRPLVGHHHSHDHHHHDHDHTPEEASVGALIALGAGGGLAPCPSALVLMLGAISLGRTSLGLLLLTSFSIGLAAVLVGIGAAVIYGRRFVPSNLPSVRWVPIASAVVIIAAGVLITSAAIVK